MKISLTLGMKAATYIFTGAAINVFKRKVYHQNQIKKIKKRKEKRPEVVRSVFWFYGLTAFTEMSVKEVPVTTTSPPDNA